MTSKEELIARMQKEQQRVPEIKTLPDGDFIIPNLSGDLSKGRVTKTPSNSTDPANKAYVDSLAYTDADAVSAVATADDYLKNDAADVGVSLTLTGDNSSADTAYVPMVLYNTDATPPTASNFPIGTIYVQYTA